MNQNEFTRRVLEAEPTLYRISKAILKNEFDCADAIQEAILKAFQKLNSLKEEKFFKTWLCRILIRECYRILKARSATVPFEEYLKSEPTFESSDIGLYNAIMLLNEKHRIVVTLHYVEGFKTTEVASMLKIPEGTVKSRLSRAKAELKILLKEEDSNEKSKMGRYIPRSI
ncbi:MAG: sigma-70 family RNA polymerase sigma factor [Oscillospiraceae bacterium]|nr:sigma-70 family RNA polymerase sigma factor [Oscillospiraceae bacterium]